MERFIRENSAVTTQEHDNNVDTESSTDNDIIVEETNEEKAEQLRTEIEQARQEIAEIDELYAKEKRFKKAKETLKFHDFESMYEFINFDNEEDFERSLSAIKGMYRSGIKEPSAGFGPTKSPHSFGTKDAYEYGRMQARKRAKGGRK